MMLRKQTVWLLTMLAVMVVLSGYYLVKGPESQVSTLGQEQRMQQQLQQDSLSDVVVESKQTDTPAPDAAPVEGKPSPAPAVTDTLKPSVEQQTATKDAATLADTPSELFIGYKMKREAQTQQQKDEQLSIMGSSDATPQAVAEAKAKYEELSTLENATTAVEEMLKTSGYKDAVVFTQNDKVTVIVQKDKLGADEVVDIISNVKQHLNVPATNITVQFKAS
ncbi:SpoIIIAH-like family protein [Brevibacillus borstelensis]|uniref:SpoIIIAH-like family protein n=1 Tax=Brevibacillus borstelensis TaxID=45462 RepID=UPI0030BC6DA8